MNPELQKEIDALPEIPTEAALAYKHHLGEMVEKVNIRMSRRPELRLLIGDNPVGMMFDNHKNHGLFMSNVFSLNEYTLLANLIPWVYRTYHGHGFSFDYFPAHLQTWREVIKETLDATSAAHLAAVYEWMISRQADFIDLAGRPIRVHPGPGPEWQQVHDSFLQALLTADRRAAMEIAKQAVPVLSKLNDFYLHVLQPAMYTIGAMWEKGELSVAREHLASALVNRVMSMQYIDLMESPDQFKGKVVVTAGANEFHEIGATMVANALEADGWEVMYLGANTPVGELLEFVSAQSVDLVAISATIAFNLEAIQAVIREIRTWPEHRQPRIMVGGQAFADYPELARKLGADQYVQNPGQAVALAEKWQKAARL